MKRREPAARPADPGDRMLMLLLESADPDVGDLARRVLEELGFEVGFAGAESPGSFELEYKKARFAVIAVADGGPAGGRLAGEMPEVNPRPPRAGGNDLFAAVFLGVDAPKGLEHAIYIEPDARGRWTDQMVETLRLLGWLS